MIDQANTAGLLQAVQRYFDLMYDADTSRFDSVFRSSAQLHGFQEGQMTMWTAQKFKEVLAGRPSPKSVNAPRQEEILLLDFASATQALAKVRVRINTIVFIDYLTYHRIDGEWMITSKAYHVERPGQTPSGPRSGRPTSPLWHGFRGSWRRRGARGHALALEEVEARKDDNGRPAERPGIPAPARTPGSLPARVG